MRTTLLSSVIALGLFGLGSASVHAQEALPLSGNAYRIAEQAFGAYERGDYLQAYRNASEAARLRPDVARLRLLQIYAAQKLGRNAEARTLAQRAIADGIHDPALPALAAAPTTDSGARAASGARPAAGARPSADELAYQRAFPLATEAYTAFNGNRFEEAAAKAEQAFRQLPQQGAWAILWVASLETAGKLDAAQDAARTALALGAPNRTDLAAAQLRIQREQAVAPAQAGYQALIALRPEEAVEPARKAVQLAPESSSHRLLLMTALLLSERLPEAVDAASDAIVQDDEDTNALVMRGYLQQRLGRSALADADFDRVLAQDWLDPQQQRNVRLLAVDAALAAGNRARAEQLLAPLKADPLADEDDDTRRAIAAAVAQRTRDLRDARPGQVLTQTSYPAPVQQCRDTPYGTQCELTPSDLQGEAGAAQRAYAAYGRQQYQQAISEARQAVQATPDSAPLQSLLTTALAAGDRRQQDEARQRLDGALAATPEDAPLLMQRGYLALRAGDPQRALGDFRAADATGKAPPTVVLDQAYANAALGQHPQAVTLLRGAIDSADANALTLDKAQRYNTRSSIANFSREWGLTLSAGYRGARQAATNLGGAAISTPGDSVFGTLEAFWRPHQFNNQYGTLEAYARLANTLYDEGGTFESIQAVDPCTGVATEDARARAERLSRSRSIAGWPSTIASFGLRYAFAQTGLSVGLERRQFVGTATRNGGVYPDSAAVQCRIQLESSQPLQMTTAARYRLNDSAGGWMSYLTYGFYHGTGVRTDVNQWWTLSGYAQAGFSWDDNRAHFSVDQIDSNGDRVARLVDSDGRLRRQQWFGAAELRAGRSYRFGADQTRWVLSPYLVVGADWIDQRTRVRDIAYPLIGTQSFALSDTDRSWSLGGGPGVGVRYWFREDHYNAARSYLDVAVQYRFAFGGGDTQRAKGLFATATLYY